jgi:hypothetical protein
MSAICFLISVIQNMHRSTPTLRTWMFAAPTYQPWPICLLVGVMLTALVSPIGRVLGHSWEARSFGVRQADPNIQYYYLVFVFRRLTIKFMKANQTLRKPGFEIKARAYPVSKKQKPALRVTIGIATIVLAFLLSLPRGISMSNTRVRIMR